MEKIIDYKVMVEEYLSDLEEAVLEAINSGFRPQGGIVHNGTNFCQAMIKTEYVPDTAVQPSDFTVIQANDTDSLISIVQDMIADGWYLYGSLQVIGASSFKQAFIKL